MLPTSKSGSWHFPSTKQSASQKQRPRTKQARRQGRKGRKKKRQRQRQKCRMKRLPDPNPGRSTGVKSGIRCRSRSNMSCTLQPSAAQGSKRREGLRLPLDGTWTRAGWKTKSGDSCRLRGTQGLLLLLPLPFEQRGCSSFRAPADIRFGHLDCIWAPGASHLLMGWNRLLLICYQSELYAVHTGSGAW